MNYWPGYALVVAGSASFGTSSIIIKLTYLSGLEPVPVLIVQNIFCVVMIWPVVFYRKLTISIPPTLRFPLAAQGIIGGMLTSILFFSALDMLGAAMATLLLFTYPAIVTAYQRIMGRVALSWRQLGALVMALAGVALSVGGWQLHGSSFSFTAVVWGLGAAMTNSFLNINGEKLLVSMDTLVMTAWSYTVSTGMLLIIYRPWWLLQANFSHAQLGLVALGAVGSIGALVIYLAGLSRIGSGIASIISTVEIPVTLCLAWLFLQESMNSYQFLGGFFIMISVITLYCCNRNCEMGS